MIVLDASAAIELLLRTPTGTEVATRIAPEDETLHAPHLLDVEIAQVLRRYVSSKEVTSSEARQALDDLVALDLERYSHDVLLPAMWKLHRNATAYDAAYLALAQLLRAPLVTCDRKLARVPGARIRIEVL
jgi:predicted nucleic acid-binding protein